MAYVFAYKLKDTETGRTLRAFTDCIVPLEVVWDSQKCFFMKGSKVEISDLKGNKKIFIR